MLNESCRYFGVPIENICPLRAKHDWTGGERRKLVLAYLEHTPDDEPVTLIDAWDSFVAGTPQEIETAFREIGYPVVISPECNLWPPEIAKYVQHPPAPTRWRYACGGGWAGFAGALREMFTAPDFWPAWAICDQAAFDHWVCTHPDMATVDHHCRLFVCGYDDGKADPPIWSVLKLKGGRPYNADTDTYPLVWHGGGGFAMQTLALWDKTKEIRGWK